MIALICATATAPDDKAYMLWLYQEFERLMYATAKKYVPEPSDCEDIVQDTLLSLIKHVQTLKTLKDCVLASYIVTAVRNTAFNHLRRKKLEDVTIVSIEDKYSELESEAAPLDDMMLLIERKAQLSRIWLNLPQDHRILLEGKYILGLSDEELGRLVHCKTDSVRMKLTRARRTALQLLIREESREKV